jgi:ParB family chromosome partitioning protein
VAGERRLRAAELLDMKTVPVIVKDFTDQEVAQATLVENIQREDLNVIDEAFAYDRLLDEFNLTQEELAGRLGKSQSTVANRRRLLKLPQSVQESLRTGDLNERHGRALLRLPDEARILEVADLIIKKNLTVRETDKLVEELLLSGAEESAAAVAKNLRRFVPRDYRIFLNSVLDAVKTLRAAGLPAEVDQTETEEYVQVKVLIPKARPGSKK